MNKSNRELEEEINLLKDEIKYLKSQISSSAEFSSGLTDLANKESLFRSLIKNINDVIFEVNSEGVFQFISPQIEQIVGYSPEEVIGKSFSHFVGNNLDIMTQRMDLIRDYKTLKSDYQLPKKGGGNVWVRVSSQAIMEDDRPASIFGTIIDISEKKEAEKALIESERKLNQSQVLAKMGSFELDLINRVSHWSKNIFNLYQIDPNEVTPSMEYLFQNRFLPEDVPVLREKMASILKNPKAENFDFRIMLPDGSIKWFNNNLIPVFKDGLVVSFEGTNQDITEKKLAEEIIKLQFDEMHATLKAIPDSIYVINKHGEFLEFYSNHSNDLLVRPKKIIGSNLKDVFATETAQLHLRKVVECIKSQSIISYEYEVILENKSHLFEARLSPIDLSKVIVLSRNITHERGQLDLIRKLSMAVEQSPVITLITDLKGNIEYVNPVFEKITGYTAEDIKHGNVALLKSEKTPKSVYYKLWKSLKSGESWHGELLNKRKDGKEYWEDLFVTPIFDNEHKITNYLAIKQDINSKKLAEIEINGLNQSLENKVLERTRQLDEINQTLKLEMAEKEIIEYALIKSEEKYRSVVENIKEVVFMTDTEGNWTFLNSAWFELTGFEIEESLGKIFVDFVYPEDRQLNWELFKPLMEGEKNYCRHEIRYLTKHGDYKWVEVYARLGLNEDDEILGTFGTLLDITERKQAEDLIKLQKDRLSYILEGANLGTWEWNAQTNEARFNEKCATMIGYTKEELVGIPLNSLLHLYHPLDSEIGFRAMDEHLNGLKSNFIAEIRMRHKDGHWIWVKDHGKIISYTPDGKPEWLYGVHEDITNRKMAELEILKAREDAERANQAKSEFLSRMSHELRTPLNSILGFAQLLELSELNSSQEKGVSHILNSGKHLLDLINEVLDLARIESGRMDLQMEPTSIDAVLLEVFEIVSPLAQKQAINIEKIIPAEQSISVYTDAKKFRQILINILNNAIKYNKKNGWVKVIVETLNHHGDVVRISIEDNGIGIAQENLNRIFVPFERIDSDKNLVEGTGLGLSVVKRLVNAVGGNVWVESELGIGSKFIIELPLILPPAAPVSKENVDFKGNLVQQQFAHTVLLIEDTLSNIELIEGVFATLRPNIQLVKSMYGKNAIELLKRHNVNLLLLDLNLPDINGAEVLKLILCDPELKDLPVFILSADVMPDHVQKILALGAKEYISKPIDIVQLLNTLDKYLVRTEK